MNAKQAKKLRKEARKQVAGTIKALNSEFKTEMNKMLKPNPRWCPGFLWYWLASKFLNV